VLVDDSFVSKTMIGDINTGDTFTCTLGDDVGAVVSYKRHARPAVRSTGGSFADVHKITKYESKITIHNKHQFPIADLVIQDVLPTPLVGMDKVKVLLRKPDELANLKNGEELKVSQGTKVKWTNEKEGKLEWNCTDIGPGKEVIVEMEWEVKAPEDFTLVESLENLFGGATAAR
jgi:hypothetical protein